MTSFSSKKKQILTITLISLFLLKFCYLYADNNIYPEDIRKIKEKGKLVVAQFSGKRQGFFMYDEKNQFPDHQSYTFNNKRIVGYDVDIAYKIAKRLGVELEIKKTAKSFTDACKLVAKREADIAISKVTITMSRGQYVRYTDPYINLKLGVLINRLEEVKIKRGPDPFEICNHPDTVMAVEQGSAWMHIVPDLFPKAKIKEYPDMKSAVKAVQKGECLATLNDEWNIGTILRFNPQMALMVRLALLPEIQNGIAIVVNPEDSNLHAYLNLIIKQDRLKTTPSYLMDKFFTKSTSALSSALKQAKTATTTKNKNQGTFGFIIIITLILVGIWFYIASKKNQ